MVYTYIGKLVVFGLMATGVLSLIIGDTMIFEENIEYIPADFILPSIIAIAVSAVVMYLVFYLVAYGEKKSEVYAEQAKAIEEGRAVDKLALDKVKTFDRIYKIAMALGIVVTSALAFAIFAVFVAKFIDFSVMKAVCYAIATEIVTYLVFDRFVGRRIADRSFRAKVLDPATDAIVSKFLAPSEAPVEEVKEVDPTEELVRQLLAAIKKK